MPLIFNNVDMNIEKIFIPGNYPDLLRRIELTSADILKIIKPFKIIFPQIRNDTVEQKIKFPFFVEAFYTYIIKNNTIPTQEVFFGYYFLLNESFFKEKQFDSTILEGLEARVNRTYPSLVRDIHFNKFINENLHGTNIIYNINLDVEEGIDSIIEKGSTFYALNFFTDTDRAKKASRKKRFRHTPFQNVTYIQLPLNLENSLKCGDFSLYGNPEFLTLKKEIGL